MLALMTAACGGNSQRVRDLEQKADSLAFVNEQQQMALDEITDFVSQIGAIMDTINVMEGVLTLRVDESGRPLGRRQILQNLDRLAVILDEKRAEISRLDSLLNQRNKEVKQLTTLVKHLYAELDQKDETIRSLREEVEAKNVKIRKLTENVDQLTDQVGTLNDTISGMKVQQEKATQEMAKMDSQINTAYYLIGTKEELVRMGVMSQAGLFKKSRLTPENIDKSQFQKVDIRTFKEISFSGANPKICTTAPPSDSYRLVNGKNKQASSLTILDPDRFWSMGQVLIIQVK